MLQIILDKDGNEKSSKTWTIEELNDMILPAEKIVANEDLPEDLRFWENLDSMPIEGEEWREFAALLNNTRVKKYKTIKKMEVSNIGRVRILRINGETDYLEQETYDKTNLQLKDYKANEVHNGKIYKLVASVWLKDTRPQGAEKWAVHHIDNNGRNNRPENLIWLSSEDHGKIKHIK